MALVLFGITGDLAKKMLLPALDKLADTGQLDVPVVGVAMTDLDLDGLRALARQAVGKDLSPRLDLRLVAGDLADAGTFDRLREEVEGLGYLTHYLAVPPSLFSIVARGLAAAGLNSDARLVVEKPFGHDLASARQLNAEILTCFDEDRLFRVDHFLGKEPVEDLVVFRFANTMLEPIWNRTYVRSVQITLAEDFGVTDRGAFYDGVGALRDVVQNHLLQLLAYVAMDAPPSGDARAALDEKWRVLRSVRTLEEADVARGQYDGYRDTAGVASDSRTETFVALRAAIDNWRWAGVPFCIRTGKCLPVDALEVVAELRRPPVAYFSARPAPNLVRFRMHPDPGVTFDLLAKEPDVLDRTCPVPVSVDFTKVLGPAQEAYEQVLKDALAGDARHFVRFDLVEESWRIVQDILAFDGAPEPYEKGTWPEGAARIAPGGWHPVGAQAL
ncbi:glucose-6-phosphate dehydrogenase [Nonomuraea sp. NPDC059194]|uniref:glucose-6-phosphate dehydrogenase n=1 Tax=Nonomuraea sp. NPDC059194 TaxID=3346764 RepID=UPI0036CC9129